MKGKLAIMLSTPARLAKVMLVSIDGSGDQTRQVRDESSFDHTNTADQDPVRTKTSRRSRGFRSNYECGQS